MTFEDWRDAGAGELVPLFEAECSRWGRGLAWDLSASIQVLEQARVAGRLPGVLARDRHGAIVGWTYFIVHDGILQIGGMVAESASIVRQLLDRVLEAPEATRARALSAFLYPVSDSLRIALERRRFTVQRHPYLQRPLGEVVAPALPDDVVARPLRQVEPADVVRLFARAYAGSDEARCFAPDGRLEQWAQYLGQLLATPGCGTYFEKGSFALVQGAEHRLSGAIITTAVSKQTAHIAQVVIDPTAQRLGLAQALIALASSECARRGMAEMTLIVAEANTRARALYERLGFCERGAFLYAHRPALTRRIQAPGARERQSAARL